MKSAEEDAYGYPSAGLSLPVSNPYLSPQYHSSPQGGGPSLSVSITPPSSYAVSQGGDGSSSKSSSLGFYTSAGLRCSSSTTPTLESPRIEITPYSHFPDEEEEDGEGGGGGGGGGSVSPVGNHRILSVATLNLPNADGYRDPSCLSPASSVSSRSCHSEASSYESGLSCTYDTSPQNSPWQSPCVSPKGGGGSSSSIMHSSSVLLGGAVSPQPSPSVSPRLGDDPWVTSRPSSSPQPSSPCGGKRKYSFGGGGGGGGGAYKFPYSPSQSPNPSPHTSPRLSVAEDTWLSNTNQYTNSAIVAAINALSTDGSSDLGDNNLPLKARRTAGGGGLELPCLPPSSLSMKIEPRGGEELGSGSGSGSGGEYNTSDYGSPSHMMGFKKEGYSGSFLDVPQHSYSWSKPKYISPSLPALDWQLPSSSGPYSLQIQVQPKSHHRAHYETEGSRGAVKALGGGHPVVQLHGYVESEPLTLQLFIGTADDRMLRPHAFYQVHRITGKTVSTPSHEVLQNATKLLEIPLLPESNMKAIIDCAGILKLRNSDIELRKGETDIGRKNTRVRMVFRVHISQANGRTISLQAASNPIECSQRSAQELPLVDKQSLASCSAAGGEKMLLTGHNFQNDSKVVFVENAQDGHHIWEMEGKVEKEATKSTVLLVEVPPYRSQNLASPVSVSFYVCNGKRRRSQCQRFTYLPPKVPTIKTEPHDDYELPPLCSQHAPGFSLHSKPSYYPPQVLSGPPMPNVDPRTGTPGPSSAPPHSTFGGPQRLGGKPPSSLSPLTPSSPSVSSPAGSPKLHDLSPTNTTTTTVHYPAQVSAIQLTGTCYQQPSVLFHHPRVISSSSPHLSTPPPNVTATTTTTAGNGGPPPGERPFGSLSPTSPVSTSQPSKGGSSPRRSPATFLPPPSAQQQPNSSPSPSPSSTSSNTTLAISIKQEPQELDQMYLDDVNEIIRNDLSSITVHSHA
ncbi:nuclear factor of activated T-cells, cytoplasmic 1-like isoform X2 [Engraulis encrasicolus]|uniref:nuclear factor of activated T-cells, cytoplasmic 1-like isoform X2 n=1 Tax=Engraulis encrasicolus TaxID=184585 RepID=UPI002FCEA005